MDPSYVIMTPFVWVLDMLYGFVGNYGMALILFTLIVRLILFPFSLKGKKSMIQMNMLSGRMQRLQKQYANNPQKYQEELQKLYAKENVNPMGGCLWSFLPLLIIIPLYAIIRQPIKYMMGVVGPDAENMFQAIAQAVNWDSAAVEAGWITSDFVEKAMETVAAAKEQYITSFGVAVKGVKVNTVYQQLYLSSLITPENVEAVKAAVAAVGEPAKEIFVVNYSFLGINLIQVPTWKFWQNGWTWASIGLFLLPLASAGISMLMSLVSQKTNNVNRQSNPQMEKTNMVMMLISPIMFLWFGFSMPAAMSVYFMASSLLGIVQEFISGAMLKKDYEQAREAQRLREIEEKEEEKRLRREKAEEKARKAEEARLNKGKKKPKEETEDDGRATPEQREASRVGIRQYARGRTYDPDRFGGVTAYDERAVDRLTAPAPVKKKSKKKD